MPEFVRELAYRCEHCGSTGLDISSAKASCHVCGATWLVRYGIVDFLVNPTETALQELRGLATENGLDAGDLAATKFMLTDHIEGLDELKAVSEGTAIDYYSQTWGTFTEGVERAGITPGAPVLEIGAERKLPKLNECRNRGAGDCYALNLFFHIERESPIVGWCHRAVADMHALPYVDGFFDLVIVSATAHHSTDLAGLFREINRVLRPGGRAIVVNEAVEGYIKKLGSRHHHDRDEQIHEEEIRYTAYRSAIKSSGLTFKPFVPRYFLERLQGSVHRDTRFYWIARALSEVACRNPAAATTMLKASRGPASAILGFPLNAVVAKPS